MSIPILTPNLPALLKLNAALLFASEQSLQDAGKVLRVWGQEYLRRVKAVTPVDIGDLRNSWQTKNYTDSKGNLQVEVGTSHRGKGGIPYAVYLEFGTERIAGGLVKKWTPGAPVILDWPAKRGDATDATVFSEDQSGGAAGRRRNAAGRFVSKRAGGRAEQMPILRPIGFAIAPQVVESLYVAVKQGVQAALGKAA